MTIPSYANPFERFVWQSPGIVQFGADNETVSYTLVGPPGKRGLVRDIMIHITEAMVGTTTVPEILVEATASALGAIVGTYARFRLGTAAATGYGTSPAVRRARSLVTGNGDAQTYEDFTGHVKLETTYIPADTAYLITLLAGAGGTETGAGQVFVFIDWY
jgi:hypothetical protein